MADPDAGRRTFRVWRVQSVEILDQPVEVPADFDLASAWERVVAGMEVLRGSKVVRAVVAPEGVPWLRGHFGPAGLTVGAAAGDGCIPLEIEFPSDHEPAHELAGYSAVLEVIDPPEVRAELARIGSRLIERYTTPA